MQLVYGIPANEWQALGHSEQVKVSQQFNIDSLLAQYAAQGTIRVIETSGDTRELLSPQDAVFPGAWRP